MIFKMGSRFRGNDKNYYVIPAKAGIHFNGIVTLVKYLTLLPLTINLINLQI